MPKKMRAIDYQVVTRSHVNKRFLKVIMSDKLTPSNVARLINQTTTEGVVNKLNLRKDSAKIAILNLYDRVKNEFPFKFDADSIKILDVDLNQNQVEISWKFKEGIMPIDNSLSIDEYLKYSTQAVEFNDILEVIKSLKDRFDNYIPLFEIRNRLKHLTRDQQDEQIYSLSREDIIELSKLSEPWFYTEEQRSAGIPTPIAGDLFFVILN